MTGLDLPDLMGVLPDGCTLTAPLASSPGADGSSSVWTATLSTGSGAQSGSHSLRLDLAGVQDRAGNRGDGISGATGFSMDAQAPVLSGDQLMLSYTEANALDSTHQPPASAFAVSAIGVHTVSVNESAKTVTLTLSRAVAHGATVTVAYTDPTAGNDANALQDLAGNDAASFSTRPVTNNAAAPADTTAPTVSAIAVTPASLRAGQTASVSFTFSEAVTGFTAEDVTVPNGTLSGLTSNDGGRTWSATLTPAANKEDASNAISVNLAGVSDAAGNAGSCDSTASNNYTVDTRGPALAANGITVAYANGANAVGIDATATVSIRFTEAVTGFTLDNLSASTSGARLSNLASGDGGLTWTATLTPQGAGLNETGSLTVDLSGVQDAADNPGRGQGTGAYRIDTARPGASIWLLNHLLKGGQGTTVTITFDEPVTGFDLNDLSASNGRLSNLSATALGTPS